MRRVPAKLAVLLLHQEADAREDDRYRIRPATLRKWVQRGHLTRGPGGYDLAEILGYVERRDGRGSVSDAIEKRAQELYDEAQSNQDPEVYGWHWTPWDDLDADQRRYWLDLAEEE